MKIFVTGASGFAGSAIVQKLINAGRQVLGLSRDEKADEVLVAAVTQGHWMILTI